jgi:hypothetical protein
VELDELRSLRRNTRLDDVDDRKVVPGGDRAGDAHSFGEPLLDEGLRERARPRPVTHE